MFQHILVAVDGSEHAHKALEIGSDIADRFDAKMTLVHVLDKGQPSEGLQEMAKAEYSIGPPLYADLFRSLKYPQFKGVEQEAERTAYLAKVFRTIAEHIVREGEQKTREKGVKVVQTSVRKGNPAKEILTCAAGKNVDLIVMGSRGVGGLQGLVLGSVSRKVTDEAKCACLTVK